MKPAILFALSLFALPALAEPVPADLQDSLTETVTEFSGVISSGDLAGTFDFMPPPLLDTLASQAGISVEDLLAATRAEIEAAMATVTIDGFTMDVAAAEWQTTPDGSIGYALIPTETVMTIGGETKMKATSQTVALQGDDGTWYLVNVDDPTKAGLMQAAYPAFAGVEFPVGTVAPAE